MPPRSRTLGALLDEIATARPDGEAVVFRGERLTYPALRDRADTLARALLALGVRKGDRVALLLPNRPEWLVTAFAAAKIGAVTVAISTFSTPREIAWTLEHAQPRVIVTMEAFRSRGYLGAIHDLCPELARAAPGEIRSERLPELRAVIGIDDRRHAGIERWADVTARARDVSATVLAAATASVSAEDVCFILYTSGSTATPKGVTLAHGGVVENGFNIGERQRLSARDRLWLSVPLFWSFGSANALPAILTHGGTIVLQEHMEPGAALALIERERCTVYYGTPNIALALTEHPDRARRDLSSLRTGAAIGAPAAMQMVMDLGAREICNVYGLTECYGNCSVTDAHDPPEVRRTTVGFPLPGQEVRVVDRESRRPLPAGEVGEILVRGRLTPGYYEDPERNAASFDADGFLLTGDLGFVGEDGRLRFRGRIKEMVKTGGINVAPAEIEEVLLGHPAVEQAYVVGVPDPRKEEILVAVVVARPGRTIEPDALRGLCKDALAAYKVPQAIHVMAREALPLTSTGKVQKFRLAEALARGQVLHSDILPREA